MVVRSKTPPMTILLNGRTVGSLHMERSGAISMVYDDDWLEWEHAVPVSLSLPLRERAHVGATVISYLDNLLPDNPAIRDRIAAKVGAKGTHPFHLLEKIGRDCVGALQFLAAGNDAGEGEPGEIEAIPVTDQEVASTLRNLASAPLGVDKETDFRISIAGVQEKTALLHMDGKWFRPIGATPTSHILKTQLGQLPNGLNLPLSVENEYFCLRFCAAMGAQVAHAEIVDFEDIRVLAVERFDRRSTNKRLFRIPQEDFCQALGYPPSLKYQSDGGPGVRAGLELLVASDQTTRDQVAFLHAQILFWLLGATDGHAKNFSIELKPGGGFQMTPLYDVLSAQVPVDEGQIRYAQYRLAMSLGRRNHYRVNKVIARHFIETATAGRVGESAVAELLHRTKMQVDSALDKTMSELPEFFPEDLAGSISRGILNRARLLSL